MLKTLVLTVGFLNPATFDLTKWCTSESGGVEFEFKLRWVELPLEEALELVQVDHCSALPG